MTSLLAWTSRDQQRFAALHIASDSRISWGSHKQRWDAGRKVFASHRTPDVLAYCGDVLFPALVLSQLISAGDNGFVLSPDDDSERRHRRVLTAMQASFARRHDAVERNFEILHASRDGSGKECTPRLWVTSVNVRTRVWLDQELPIDVDRPGVIVRLGSGRVPVKNTVDAWQRSSIGETSRAIYGGFCEALASGADPMTGGAPQLASLYPKGPGRTSGALHEGQLYLHGLPIDDVSGPRTIEWYDELFQRVDPATMTLLEGAARQPRPKVPMGTPTS